MEKSAAAFAEAFAPVFGPVLDEIRQVAVAAAEAKAEAKAKPYKCPTCSQRFMVSEERRLHALSHNHATPEPAP